MGTTEQRTVGQIERELSQKIQALYRKHLGHQPSKVSCQLFSRKLVVVLEDSVTQPEKLLMEEGQLELAEKVRTDLNEAIQPQIKVLVEEVLGVDVLDLLCDAAIETGRVGMIAVLSSAPTVRNPEAIPKLKK
ncbi:DUF2294 domain-containing protein [cf. Phormidesmis sp. LEGE 11477]|uniref:DUF2294 domain-containing protein n=1 Tax=cf. Phormidesmis sp. LEGE 11477 TaxID=1828680 RepID=UPI00187E0014|nr:DUF2294 domain-containing protein [cf. Phormidesmis sp. LEGE 11477]MBE9061707.1 DUF2294 domain-containing protein [cf. Phormidesmis sp. LEGE 11477]